MVKKQTVKKHLRSGKWIRTYKRRKRPKLKRWKAVYKIKPTGIRRDKYGRILGRIST